MARCFAAIALRVCLRGTKNDICSPNPLAASLLVFRDGYSIAAREQPGRQVGELFCAEEVVAIRHDGLLEPPPGLDGSDRERNLSAVGAQEGDRGTGLVDRRAGVGPAVVGYEEL